MQINLILAKLVWMYDMEILDPDLDWEGQSHQHVMWQRPNLMVRFSPRRVEE